MLFVCLRDVMDVVFSVCIVRRRAVGARVWKVGLFRHTVLNPAFYITCRLLMLIEDARGDHMEEAY